VPAVQLPGATPPASPQTTVHGDVPAVMKECVEKYLALRELGDATPPADRQATVEICKAALEQSGLSGAEFWAKFGPDAQKTVPQVKRSEGTANPELEAMIKECVRQRLAGTDDQSDACRKAIAASGLTPQEFWTKVRVLSDKTKSTKTTVPTKPVTRPEPSAKPAPSTAEASQLIAKCLQMYAEVKTTGGGDTKAVSEACGVAIRASGLSSADFWAKYHPTTATN
jgi:hypothetical protein